MNLVRQPAHALFEFADDQRVDVFVGGALKEPGLLRFSADLLESVHQTGTLLRSQDADALQRAGEGLRAPAISVQQPPVEVQRAGEALKDLGRSAFESPAPKLHFGH